MKKQLKIIEAETFDLYEQLRNERLNDCEQLQWTINTLKRLRNCFGQKV